jgi:hypothetical protein
MFDSTIEFIAYALLGMLSFYVPLQAYARRMENRWGWASSAETRFRTISVAYLIWYTPAFILLFTVWLSENFHTDFSFLPFGAAILGTFVGCLYIEYKNKR